MKGEAKRDLKLFKTAFNRFISKTTKRSRMNLQKRKAIFDKSWKAYEAHLALKGSSKDKSNKNGNKHSYLPIICLAYH
jgi:hypothetical protein